MNRPRYTHLLGQPEESNFAAASVQKVPTREHGAAKPQPKERGSVSRSAWMADCAPIYRRLDCTRGCCGSQTRAPKTFMH